MTTATETTASRRSRALVFDDRVDAEPRVRRTEVRAPGPGEVRVRMRAAGVCHSDLHAINGDWPTGQRVVLGHEGAGTVDAIGPGVSDLDVGDLVSLNWYASCLTCAACLRDRPWLCAQSPAVSNTLPGGLTATSDDASGEEVWPYLGVGAFAEYVVVPAHAAIALPAEVPAAVAAIVGCSVTTGYGAVVHTAAVEPGESAVVVGCGGVGQAIILALALRGASRIVAVDRSPEKLEAARAAGATDLVLADGDERDRLRALLPEGADVAFDAIGAPAVSGYLPRHVVSGGRCVLVGMPRVDGTAEIDTWDLVTRGVTLIGCNYGSSVPRRDFPAIAALYLDGRLPLDLLLGPRISLDAATEAIRALPTHGGGRIVVDLDARTANGTP
ncbi:alcohol dehydrogenase catalytic domain-containing protein [Microbacterium sp.]|uniref:alcohol dehydrogenase catalytic domain-containing protein n=1 Tax=Microbacterium sp. TaxID=51671 RepID=UPI0039E6E66D